MILITFDNKSIHLYGSGKKCIAPENCYKCPKSYHYNKIDPNGKKYNLMEEYLKGNVIIKKKNK
jgi:hypothetical protein